MAVMKKTAMKRKKMSTKMGPNPKAIMTARDAEAVMTGKKSMQRRKMK
jgi:hypothetical protein